MSSTVKIDALVAEIGSTTTVVNAFDNLSSKEPIFIGQGHAPTTVLDGDVRLGLQSAINSLKKTLGAPSIEYGTLLATSSAAGGLKMTVHGLVPDMTARAAKEAALGAGAVIKLITCGRLRDADLKKIKEINPNIILLAGGVDYGERETALFNAERLLSLYSSRSLAAPLIYAGNIENREEIEEIFRAENVRLYITENVYPKIDVLNVGPARKIIQKVFEEHIIHAPGMNHIRDMVDGPIIPTPGAVMEAAEMLYAKIGDLAVIDVGGATTDVHSVTDGSPEVSRLLISPEPKAKRTVEGDLGVYLNAWNIIELIGKNTLEAELSLDINNVMAGYTGVPKNAAEAALVERLTIEAAQKAVERHAGRLRTFFGPSGRAAVAEGKDLTAIKFIIGTGGAFARLTRRKELILRSLPANITGELLLPKGNIQFLTDNDYLMASTGVLRRTNNNASLKLLKNSLGI